MDIYDFEVIPNSGDAAGPVWGRVGVLVLHRRGYGGNRVGAA